MIHRFLCLIGIHYWIEYDDFYVIKIACPICGAIKKLKQHKESK